MYKALLLLDVNALPTPNILDLCTDKDVNYNKDFLLKAEATRIRQSINKANKRARLLNNESANASSSAAANVVNDEDEDEDEQI